MESVTLPVAVGVAMEWYEHELLLSAAAQVLYYYLRMRSFNMTVKTVPAKNRNSRTACYGHEKCQSGFIQVVTHLLLPRSRRLHPMSQSRIATKHEFGCK